MTTRACAEKGQPLPLVVEGNALPLAEIQDLLEMTEVRVLAAAEAGSAPRLPEELHPDSALWAS